MKNYTTVKRRLLRDPEVRRAYGALGPEYALSEMIIKRRIERGLTQKELAKKIGTTQSAVSRLESGRYNPTVDFLRALAKALNRELKISL